MRATSTPERSQLFLMRQSVHLIHVRSREGEEKSIRDVKLFARALWKELTEEEQNSIYLFQAELLAGDEPF